ncbi:Fe(3+) dicitrate ABC transporter substrate-binding protein [Gynuella sunshinyii]|uniref:ABC-type Fe3+-citrate transport system, periplasmic component n=1 Tax=Gynuella sunshinyii YC6258 TaxID=1445510 RepID=A0A0C5VE07_9GAMM|nr:Fe(3+) dicitrate ABC transporter substrate-binding protein [Gynuella sunshinyii]AJQ97550.1 ABC-type Fe3+-citrate transport system, periplasmic component [Gynuella sunshinyii YC6258]
MLKHLFSLLAVSLLFSAVMASAVTVQDQKGTFTLDQPPERIVVLEFSFADALAVLGLRPIGIADDKNRDRLLPAVSDVVGDYTSVGTRAQPSLEMIAALKPDLIIADIERHEGIYDELNKIAPTLILTSRSETYEQSLQSAVIIAKVVGKEPEMQARLQQHRQTMQDYARQLPAGAQVQFGVAREDALFLHTSYSYAGGVIQALGMTTPDPGLNDHSAYRQVSLEQLVALNPEYLMIGPYATNSLDVQWHSEPLWQLLTAVQQHHVYHVNGNTWSRCRGILAAEAIARDMVAIMSTR